MNRWILPSAVVAGVAALTAAATVTGPQPVPETPFAASETRVSVVCPGFQSATATIRVAAVGAGPGVRTAPVTAPATATDESGLRVLANPPAPLRVSAVLPDPFGASAVVAASAGGDRGLSATSCVPPATTHWFTGVDIRSVAQSEVVVANLDGTPASVDVVAFGPEGRLAAPRGVPVDGNAVATISLGTLQRTAGPITVQVGSSDGRVAAFVRQRTWRGDAPLGADWLPSDAGPATELVIPGVPAGEGTRTLVIGNPGDRTATVTVGSLTPDGPADLAGVQTVEVPPVSTRSVDLATGLDARPAALRLSSTQPVTAGVALDAGRDDARHDPAYTVATRPLPSDSVWPVALGTGTTTVLQLANPGTAAAVVSVGIGADADAPARDVTVPAGTLVQVPLPKASAQGLRVRTAATGVRAALVATARLGKVRGLAVVDLAAEQPQGQAPVVFDPHAGS